MNQSKELTAFYYAYWDWLVAGAPEGQPFYRNWGLCKCLSSYYKHDANRFMLNDEMKAQFKNELKLCNIENLFPFGYSDFQFRERLSLMHTCPKRRAWVKEHRHGTKSRASQFLSRLQEMVGRWCTGR